MDILENITDFWTWLVKGKVQQLHLLHAPDDTDSREVLMGIREGLSVPAVISEAENVQGDNDAAPTELTPGKVAIVEVYEPGLLRTWLWNAMPIEVSYMEFSKEA